MAQETERGNLASLLSDLAEGRLTRRQFVRSAAAIGVSAPLIGILAQQPEAVLAQETPSAKGTEGPPGPAADTVTFSAFNVDQAPLNIEHGDMDLYLFGLKTAGAQSLAKSKDVRLIKAPASTVDLLLNPAPAPQGELNPFSIPEVRQAMQDLVDRDFIVNDIYQGNALPMITSVSPLDYDQVTIFPVVSASNIQHDPETAQKTIGDAMTKAGAKLANNVWTFNGQPITLKIVTRVEDERRDIGDLIRSALQKIGFQAQPLYQQFGPATLAVYASDPKTFQWHIYTEGWGRSAPVRYDDAGINQFAAPWMGNMPGWQEVGFWQYENKDLDDLGKKLYRGQFKSRDERDDLYRQMTQIALKDSVRIWLATLLQSFPVRDDVENLTEDLVSGPKNIFALRGADVKGRKNIKVGHLWVWTEQTTWNPVAGLSDVYSTDIHRNLVDPPLVNHPFSGLPQEFRASYKVETSGPSGTMPVPNGTVTWDAQGDRWAPVLTGATAVSKVTYDYGKFFQSKWHHGVPIDMADVIYSISQAYEIAYDQAKVQIETALGITSRPYLETFVGYRLVDDTHIEVYVNYWHFEESYIASYATPSSVATPWELLAAMDDVVYTKRRGAYSNTTAARFNVPWISLVTETDARLVLRSVQQFQRQKAVPKGVFAIGGKTFVTPEQAVARYQACQKWFNEKNLLVLSNGPFMLTKYDPPSQFAQLDAFRDANYPFTAADFRYGTAPKLAISPIKAPKVQTGQPITVQVNVTGPGKLTVLYTLVDAAASKVVTSGDAKAGSGGAFTVSIGQDVTANLFPGLYQLYILAASDAIAEVAEQRLDLQIGV
jgi:peptide/nickel transport system substrate-binding protein